MPKTAAAQWAALSSPSFLPSTLFFFLPLFHAVSPDTIGSGRSGCSSGRYSAFPPSGCFFPVTVFSIQFISDGEGEGERERERDRETETETEREKDALRKSFLRQPAGFYS